jgi:hypothetical protein
MHNIENTTLIITNSRQLETPTRGVVRAVWTQQGIGSIAPVMFCEHGRIRTLHSGSAITRSLETLLGML